LSVKLLFSCIQNMVGFLAKTHVIIVVNHPHVCYVFQPCICRSFSAIIVSFSLHHLAIIQATQETKIFNMDIHQIFLIHHKHQDLSFLWSKSIQPTHFSLFVIFDDFLSLISHLSTLRSKIVKKKKESIESRFKIHKLHGSINPLTKTSGMKIKFFAPCQHFGSAFLWSLLF